MPIASFVRHVAPHGLVPWERKFGWLGRPSLANQALLPTGQAGAGASSIVYV